MTVSESDTAGRAGSRSLDVTVADPDRLDDAAVFHGPKDPAEDPTLRRPSPSPVQIMPRNNVNPRMPERLRRYEHSATVINSRAAVSAIITF